MVKVATIPKIVSAISNSAKVKPDLLFANFKSCTSVAQNLAIRSIDHKPVSFRKTPKPNAVASNLKMTPPL